MKKRLPKKDGARKQHEENEDLFSACPPPTGKSCVWRALSSFVEFCNTYALVFGMILVLIVGVQLPSVGRFLAKIPTEYICTVLAFFVCGLQIKDGGFLAAIKNFKAIVLGILLILLVIPALGVEITKTVHFATLAKENMTTEHSVIHANVSAIGPTEVAVGLQVFYVVPATLSTGAILVMLAGGDTTLSLLLMLITNVLGIFIVPPLLMVMTDLNDSVPFKDLGFLVVCMFLTVHLPTIMGGALRFSHRVSDLADSWSKVLRHVLIALLLFTTLPEVSRAQADDEYANILSMNMLTIVGYSSIMHVMFLLITWLFASALKLDTSSKKAIVIVGSHKALIFALKILEFLPAESVSSKNLMSVSCIIAYLTVLVLDSVVVSKWATISDEESDQKRPSVEGKYGTVPQEE